MRIFKKGLLNFMTGWLILTIFIISAAILLNGPFPLWGYYWITMTLLLILPLLASYQINSLTIDSSKGIVIIEWRKWMVLRKVEEFPIHDIRAELTNETNKLGRKHCVFRIYDRDRLLSQMVTWFTGWHKDTAMAFIVELAF